MKYFKDFQKYNTFKELVENQAKSFNFSDLEFLEDLYKWFKEYSKENILIFKKLSSKTTISTEEKNLLNQKVKDASFAFDYLKMFGNSFLNICLNSPKAISNLRSLYEQNKEFSYLKTVNPQGKGVYVFKNQEFETKFLDELLTSQTGLDKDQAMVLSVLLVGSPEISSMLVLNYLNRV